MPEHAIRAVDLQVLEIKIQTVKELYQVLHDWQIRDRRRSEQRFAELEARLQRLEDQLARMRDSS